MIILFFLSKLSDYSYVTRSRRYWCLFKGYYSFVIQFFDYWKLIIYLKVFSQNYCSQWWFRFFSNFCILERILVVVLSSIHCILVVKGLCGFPWCWFVSISLKDSLCFFGLGFKFKVNLKKLWSLLSQHEGFALEAYIRRCFMGFHVFFSSW